MTYNVFGGTLNFAQLINQSITLIFIFGIINFFSRGNFRYGCFVCYSS